jgi:hypothetical protein
MKQKLLMLTVILISVFSCSDDLESIENNQSKDLNNSSTMMRASEDEKPDFHSKIVLGKKLKNPY